MGEMETTVELHRRIVAAASRLATDKSTNKSVRKKRQKDLQAAKQKLNRLEQGLQQMRHSASKPDISSFNSDSNSWTISSNGALTMAMTKSCPTTPRGSVPDLSSHTDGERNEAEEGLDDVPRRAPSTAAMRALQQQQRYSGTSSSSATSADSMGLGLPPRPNSRKSIASCSHADPLDNPLADPTNPLYENVGYRSTSYRSSYRQAHYPTIQDEHHQRKRAQSAHSIALEPGSSGRVPCSYSIPMQDATQRFAQNDQDDVTPTAENPHPIRRLPTSISCGAGLGTASLDRRNGFPRSHLQTSEDLNRRISPPTHRITTFPVSHPTSIMPNRSYSTNSSATEMPRFQPPPSRLGPFPSRVALPPYNGVTQKPSLTTVSASKLPVNTNPQMEALLHYYKQQKRNQQPPKTATIV
ncbi:unnamed protein product [Caenorhabditis auriculariae]|uniref:Uncharacterized protein n=1 Tax=Caenorhabditis auriculariae TaxID=2777116 RepID=A0A8S1H905_9PELO|nr:unnamed protein product [Caenorhabditis auriculariae]